MDFSYNDLNIKSIIDVIWGQSMHILYSKCLWVVYEADLAKVGENMLQTSDHYRAPSEWGSNNLFQMALCMKLWYDLS